MKTNRSNPIRLLSLTGCLISLTGIPALADVPTTPEQPKSAHETSGVDGPQGQAGVEGHAGVEGQVTDRNDPVGQVTVYAYEVASSELVQVATDALGKFLFEGLPAGMYKLVAFKPGFQPAVELLLRRRDDDRQFVELNLKTRDAQTDPELSDAASSEFWKVRGRVPMDVLRQMDDIERQATLPTAGMHIDGASVFKAEMQAFSGVENLGPVFGDAHLRAADLGVEAMLGQIGVDIDGTFRRLSPGETGMSVDGMVKALAVRLEPGKDHELRITGSNGYLSTGHDAPVDLSHYQVDWSGRTGKTGSTRVSASYMAENNYFWTGGAMQPSTIADSSETWGVEGAYTGQLTEQTQLEAGVIYHQRSLGGFDQLDERLGLFTTAESQVQNRVFVEYGLYSSVRDGSLSLVPHGGVVVRLGDKWHAETNVSRRVEETSDDFLYQGYQSALFSDTGSCREVGQACYEVSFGREDGDDTLEIGAVHREFSETLRLYFSSDFFNRLESVFLVKGDELPELQFSMVRRISPKVLARLESNIASGGGGIFYTTDQLSYENEVRYLVTSLDALFQSTATGVFVAFHHLEQALNPVQIQERSDSPAKLELQRLQLMLTQDLNVLADLASRWAVNLNMELSRGATPYALTADGRTYRKLTGGFSVSF